MRKYRICIPNIYRIRKAAFYKGFLKMYKGGSGSLKALSTVANYWGKKPCIHDAH